MKLSLVLLACALTLSQGSPTGAASYPNGENPANAGFTVENDKGRRTEFSDETFSKLRRQTVKVKDRMGHLTEYEGVTLAAVLEASGTSLGKSLRGPMLAHYLVIEAADGYRVVFALPELDPAMTDKVVLLADRKDGKPLTPAEGPYRVIVPDDKRPARWVKRVSKISIQEVPFAAGKRRG